VGTLSLMIDLEGRALTTAKYHTVDFLRYGFPDARFSAMKTPSTRQGRSQNRWTLEVMVPEEFTGDIIPGRSGAAFPKDRLPTSGGRQIVKRQGPLGEGDPTCGLDLRSLTGEYLVVVLAQQDVPHDLGQKITGCPQGREMACQARAAATQNPSKPGRSFWPPFRRKHPGRNPCSPDIVM